jgi:chromosome partitioning protein
MSRNSAQIITFANIKGGVGKTTAVVNIAYLLATEFGKKVLVVDSDDQGNATKSLGVKGQHDHETESLWYALNNKKTYSSVMVESAIENIWVIPSTKDLKSAQIAFGQSARGLKLMKRLLKNVEKDFDFVLFDTKPQINILLQSALAASNWYIIPSFPEPDSYDGFVDLVDECEEIYEEENDELNCLGVFFTQYKKIPAHDTYLKFISKHLRSARVPLIKTAVRSSNAMATGGLHACPAVALPGAYAVKEDYIKITRSILSTISRNRISDRPDLEALGIIDADGERGTGFVINNVLEEIKI